MTANLNSKGTILVTGGAGYIGSHTCIELLKNGYEVVVIDNLVNSKQDAITNIEKITGKRLTFFAAPVQDQATLTHIFENYSITAVIHFAALKAVGESVAQPLAYYRNNLDSLFVLLETMQLHGVKQLVFSSSATVYGNPHQVPIDESFPLSPTNPYGQTKLIAEQVLRDLDRADNSWRIATLRYFNPVGAHPSGLIGEDPSGPPNNLMPCIAQVAANQRAKLLVFGGDYPTPDGTGVRDYIHVVDLARGHLAALDALSMQNRSFVVNLGTGCGYSVLQLIHAFEMASQRSIPYEIVERRPGDIATCYADASAAQRLLGWQATHDITQMCVDQWRWQTHCMKG